MQHHSPYILLMYTHSWRTTDLEITDIMTVTATQSTATDRTTSAPKQGNNQQLIIPLIDTLCQCKL